MNQQGRLCSTIWTTRSSWARSVSKEWTVQIYHRLELSWLLKPIRKGKWPPWQSSVCVCDCMHMCVGVFAAVPCCSQLSRQQWPGLCDSLAPGGQGPLCHRAWVNSRSPPAHALGHRVQRLNPKQVSVPGDGSWPWGCSLCGCWLMLGLSLFQKWLRLWYYLDSFRRHPSVDWDATGWYKMIYFFQSISWWQ